MSRQARTKHVSINFNSTTHLRAKLQEEITKLERQLQHLYLSDDAADISKNLSYQHMISSRRKMLSRLPR